MNGEMIATRQAYGEELQRIGALDSRVVVLDADLSSSTGTKKFAEAFPERFFNMGIAEQEQKGVITPIPAAIIFPDTLFFPPRRALIFD